MPINDITIMKAIRVVCQVANDNELRGDRHRLRYITGKIEPLCAGWKRKWKSCFIHPVRLTLGSSFRSTHVRLAHAAKSSATSLFHRVRLAASHVSIVATLMPRPASDDGAHLQSIPPKRSMHGTGLGLLLPLRPEVRDCSVYWCLTRSQGRPDMFTATSG